MGALIKTLAIILGALYLIGLIFVQRHSFGFFSGTEAYLGLLPIILFVVLVFYSLGEILDRLQHLTTLASQTNSNIRNLVQAQKFATGDQK